MATIAHTIYSHYDPPPATERSTRLDWDDSTTEEWETEAALSRIPQQRPPPHFVPAMNPHAPQKPQGSSSSASGGGDLASWYRSLTTQEDHGNSAGPSTSSSPVRIPRYSDVRPRGERKNKNNWFIFNAIQSEPMPPSSMPPTLADILARDPPPLPSEAKYSPPVWLALGPSNKGFEMLQRSGWSEGEALGPDIPRNAATDYARADELFHPNGTRSLQPTVQVKEEIIDTTGIDGDVSERWVVEVIDLTLSDSESEPDSETPSCEPTQHFPQTISSIGSSNPGPSVEFETISDSRKALLTPIATVLKSDRLGIGLKAKTVGPYKASQKRVTHNAAALAAHIKAAEERRNRVSTIGKGRRAFTRQKKAEERSRRGLLAYMNS
ncbi:hypothetical protein BD779DRAFT_1498803 [Infundibulicybe gibba]|nr:hypothetical protein BD779DRAFT_1498803 [Infundibulicybe gibba]